MVKVLHLDKPVAQNGCGVVLVVVSCYPVNVQQHDQKELRSTPEELNIIHDREAVTMAECCATARLDHAETRAERRYQDSINKSPVFTLCKLFVCCCEN